MGIIFDSGFFTMARELYPFTSFTFTNTGLSSSLGPTLAQFRAAYTGSTSGSYFGTSSFFSQSSFQGYQLWTVPKTGMYEIETAGSRAGRPINSSWDYGKGAIIKGRINLNQGDKITLVVGQCIDSTGSNNASSGTYAGLGGGGGSFVASGSIPLIVAGGGGGVGRYSVFTSSLYVGVNGTTGPTGSLSVRNAPGGTGSMGGRSHINTASVVSSNGYDGGGGGGFLGNGYNGDGSVTKPYSAGTYGEGGYSFVSGAVGGREGTSWGRPSTYASTAGGFGGGGAGNGIIVGGGGGGYSGGAGTWGNGTPQTDGAGGGGSYFAPSFTNVATSNGLYDGSATFSGSAVSNLNLYNTGSGYIKITFIG